VNRIAHATAHFRALLAAALVAAGSSLGPPPAWSQPPDPVPRFVIDARGAIPIYPDSDGVAVPRDLSASAMPAFGLGLDVGAHLYPFRWKAITFGFGASYLTSRGGHTPEVPEGGTATPEPRVEARLTAFSPQLSFNFGHRLGWSYLSGGLGAATFRAWREDRPEEDGEATKTLNYGGGARWFLNPRLAFSLDLRFYAMNPLDASEATAGHPRMTLMVATAGVSFR
jgi:hypothetical protein